MKFGQRLKELREIRNLKPEELANGIQFTKSIIWSYENGSKEPSAGHLIRLAEYFNISVDDLLCREKHLTIHLENLVHNNLNRYSFIIDDKEVNSNELNEVITYIKVKRMMEIEKK